MTSHLASLWKWDFWNSEMAYFKIARPKNLSYSKFGYYLSLTNNLMKYIFANKYN